MRPQLKIQAVSIVLRGQFNPAMFHPVWFASQNLIRPQEAESADVKIIHANLAVFDVEWLQVSITPDRFIVATGQEGSTTGNRGQPSHCFWSSRKAWEGRPRRLGKMGGLGTL